MIWVGLTSAAMSVPAGWQASFFAWLQHIGRGMTGAFSWLPNWTAALALLVLVALLAWRALKQVGGATPDHHEPVSDKLEPPVDETTHEISSKEAVHER